MKRPPRLLCLLGWLSAGLSACFAGSSSHESADGDAPDARIDAGNPDATVNGEGSADATTDDAAREGEAPESGSDAGTVDEEATAPDVEAGVEASDDGAFEAEASAGDGSVEAAPPIDAGVGCLPPGAESPLLPAAEGLPSSGLVLWLRGDHGVYMTAANRVCAWADQSPNGYFFTPTGSVRPLFLGVGPDGGTGAGDGGGQDGGAIGAIGGQPSVYFDAAGSFLTGGGVLGIPATSARTFIAVTRTVIPGGRFHSIMMGESGSPGTYVMLDANTWQTAGNLEGLYVTNNSYDTALGTSTASRVHVSTFSTLTAGLPVAGNVDYRINGATQSLTLRAGSGTLASFSTANFTAVGVPDTTSSVGLAGTAVVAEVIVYARALDVTERASVESALMARYGIP